MNTAPAIQQTFTEQAERKLIPFNAPAIDKQALRKKFNSPITFMTATTKEQAQQIKKDDGTEQAQRKMNALPLEIYNELLSYYLDNGRLRDAMYLVCAANYGMRYSDLRKLKFCNVIDKYSGEIRAKFTLADGEQKTKKQNYYYNNLATQIIIQAYLEAHPEKKPTDYMFVAEKSNNKKRTESGNQTPLERKAVEYMLKDSLFAIGIIPANHSDRHRYTYDSRYRCIEESVNTHSMRKVFAENFVKKAMELKSDGILNIDWEALELLQSKFLHTSMETTGHYTEEIRKAQAIVCSELDLGLETLLKYFG